MILLSRVGRNISNISNIISCYIISRRSRLCFFRGGFFYKNIAKRIIGLVSVLIFLCSKISCIQIFVLPLTEIVNV